MKKTKKNKNAGKKTHCPRIDLQNKTQNYFKNSILQEAIILYQDYEILTYDMMNYNSYTSLSVNGGNEGIFKGVKGSEQIMSRYFKQLNIQISLHFNRSIRISLRQYCWGLIWPYI